MRIKKENR